MGRSELRATAGDMAKEMMVNDGECAASVVAEVSQRAAGGGEDQAGRGRLVQHDQRAVPGVEQHGIRTRRRFDVAARPPAADAVAIVIELGEVHARE